jgi:hypothetical protein
MFFDVLRNFLPWKKNFYITDLINTCCFYFFDIFLDIVNSLYLTSYKQRWLFCAFTTKIAKMHVLVSSRRSISCSCVDNSTISKQIFANCGVLLTLVDRLQLCVNCTRVTYTCTLYEDLMTFYAHLKCGLLNIYRREKYCESKLQNKISSRYSDWIRAGGLRGQLSSPSRGSIFSFSTSSRPALGSTQPSIEWVPGALSPELQRPGRDADHSPSDDAEVKKM